eukprot:CAMPEP_0198305860 /NCGR_PEP_ID=MMETSP1449-20131203/58123_1 /TAXON_ID=420275 /ORGANISM="Attheya septentrionalis, Strain CCMP2084" /LENGTH=481 /DNA_ID=CAMNT_0044008403 /DNA_START=457 /DNA_END=1902 /DNA_ORIENTATION=-
MVEVEQNVPICLTLSAVGGIMEVFATALLAVADAQTKAGIKWSRCGMRLALIGNVVLQLSASMVGNLLAPWFGPVSLVAPTFLAAQLLANMVLYGVVLGLESFTKDMRIGTYVIVVGAILLPVVGPQIQNDQDIWALLTSILGGIWSILLLVGMLGSGVLLVLAIKCPCSNKSRKTPNEDVKENSQSATAIDMIAKFPKEWHRVAILLVARATSFTINLTVSKMMIMNVSREVFILALVLKIMSGAVMTFGIVVQSTSVTQGTFVPLNATFTILVNALTGIIVWEDWRVIEGAKQWIGYGCVFLLFALGNYLLLGDDVKLLDSDNSTYGRGETLRFLRGKSTLLQNAQEAMNVFSEHNLSTIYEEDKEDYRENAGAGDTSVQAAVVSPTESQRSDAMKKTKEWQAIYNVDDDYINVGPRHRIKSVFFQNDSLMRDVRNQSIRAMSMKINSSGRGAVSHSVVDSWKRELAEDEDDPSVEGSV